MQVDPDARSRARFIAGDPLRGLACLGVVAYHVVAMSARTGLGGPPPAGGFPTGAYGPIGDVAGLGGAGVIVFFALSGYLISRPFVSAFVAGGPVPRLATYLRNRILRIVPAYWVVLTCVVALAPAPGLTTTGALHAYAFDGHWGSDPLAQAWTLDVEMRFYLLVPLIALVLMAVSATLARHLRRNGRAALVVAAAMGVAAGEFAWGPAPLPPAKFGLVFSLPWFMAGIAVAAFECAALARSVLDRLGAFAPALAVLGALLFYGPTELDLQGVYVTGSYHIATVSIGLIILAPLLHQWRTGRAWRVLDNAPLRWAGSRSYSLYLVHGPILIALSNAIHLGYKLQLVVLGATTFAAAFSSAEILHRLVERPFLRRRVRSQVVPAATRPRPAEG